MAWCIKIHFSYCSLLLIQPRLRCCGVLEESLLAWPQAFFHLLPLHSLKMSRFVLSRRARGASNAFSISSTQKLKIFLCSCSRLGTERLAGERFCLSLCSFSSLLRVFRFQSAEHCLLMTLLSTPL